VTYEHICTNNQSSVFLKKSSPTCEHCSIIQIGILLVYKSILKNFLIFKPYPVAIGGHHMPPLDSPMWLGVSIYTYIFAFPCLCLNFCFNGIYCLLPISQEWGQPSRELVNFLKYINVIYLWLEMMAWKNWRNPCFPYCGRGFLAKTFVKLPSSQIGICLKIFAISLELSMGKKYVWMLYNVFSPFLMLCSYGTFWRIKYAFDFFHPNPLYNSILNTTLTFK
jgi:hypothetical protein